MSTQELQTLAQQFADAFNKKNLSLVLDMLSEDVEVFDHVPYRFDNKAQCASYLSEATEGIASMRFGFRQPSYRVFNGSTGIMNAYDSFLGPNPTLLSPTANSPHVAVTGVGAKEGLQFYEAVIAIKSTHGISTTSCQKG